MKKILYSSLFLSILQSILFWHKSPGISIAIFLTATIILTIYSLKEKEMIKKKRNTMGRTNSVTRVNILYIQ